MAKEFNKKLLFPNKKNVDKSKIQISNESKYSTTPPKDADRISKIIKTYFCKNNNDNNICDITVTDATSNVGGNTLSFAKFFTKVNAVEYNKIHCDMLKNNVNLYKYDKKVNIICDDYTKVMMELKQDVVFFDPPWGGSDYRYKDKLPLKLGDILIQDIVNKLKNTTKMIVLKLPQNFDFIEFFKTNIYTKKIHFYQFRKYVVIVLLNRTKANNDLDDYSVYDMK